MGRKKQSQKTVFQNLMWNTWYETKKGTEVITIEQGKVLAAIGLVLERLEEKDKFEKTYHRQIFIKSYLSVDRILSNELTSGKIFERGKIEIVRNQKGLFYTIDNDDNTNSSKLSNRKSIRTTSKKIVSKMEVAEDFYLGIIQLRKFNTHYIWLFEHYYNGLAFLLN